MRILYVFPHPDDESFGPAAAIARQLRQGYEVHLLTLTRGGATRQRHRLGLSVAEMGAVRYREMLEVARTLGLTGMTVLDLPDSGLKEMDPRTLEQTVAAEIERVRPQVTVTYPVHGISGFHDHLVVHAIVKRAFLELRGRGASCLRRLAFYTLSESNPALQSSIHPLTGSTAEEIDCIVEVDDEDVAAMEKALACYRTYQQTVADSNVLEITGRRIHFEIFGEQHEPPLADLTAGLRAEA